MTVRPRLLVVGEAVIDVVVHADGTVARHPGGSPANVALALGRLGHRPRLLTSLAWDAHGAAIHDWLMESTVHVDPGSWTATATATSTVIARLDASGAAHYDLNIEWNPGLPQSGPVDLVHVGSISATLRPGDHIVRQIISRDVDESVLVSYDPNIRAGLITDRTRTRDAVLALIERSDLVKLSDEDLAWILPHRSLDDAARAVLRRGPALVVVTRGGQGASAYTIEGVVSVPAPHTDVVDTIGAGDTLMAALIAALIDCAVIGADRPDARARLSALTSRDIMDIVGYAVQAAAITVSRAGADPPWSHELGLFESSLCLRA